MGLGTVGDGRWFFVQKSELDVWVPLRDELHQMSTHETGGPQDQRTVARLPSFLGHFLCEIREMNSDATEPRGDFDLVRTLPRVARIFFN